MLPEDLASFIKIESAKQLKTRIDIGMNGRFEIKVKGFTWVLPKGAYSRAVHQFRFSNLDVFALHPLDIVALKCDRVNDKDLEDITAIFMTLRPPKEQISAIFEEYNQLLEGNKSSIDNIRENFYQLVLAMYDLTLKK
jgi:hypothetical protein